jgi:hypothetical protein
VWYLCSWQSTSFEEIQEWVSGMELKTFDILMCVGNKADRVPSHFGHTEYRRRLQKRGESSSDPHPEYMDFGIEQTEGSKLLGGEDQESLDDRRHSCIEWCSERGIEYIEACAINEVFDQCKYLPFSGYMPILKNQETRICDQVWLPKESDLSSILDLLTKDTDEIVMSGTGLSVDGDLQGIARIEGALSAHMWPGLVMKPLNKLTESSAAPQEIEGGYPLLPS